MNPPLKVPCEICGADAPVQMLTHTGSDGGRVEWPKAVVRPDGIYFAIDCPTCGEREQCVAKPSDA
jgi:ribosomal protein S27E